MSRTTPPRRPIQRTSLGTLALLAALTPASPGDEPKAEQPSSPAPTDAPRGVIAFASLGTRHWDLYTQKAGADPAPVTDHPALDYNAAFSPDGTRIAFVSRRDGNPELYSAAPDGSGAQRLTDHHAMDDHPAWSPDGKHIAFVSTREPAPAEHPRLLARVVARR